jgi:hypothetical protein
MRTEMRTEELRDWLVQALVQLPVEQRLAVELRARIFLSGDRADHGLSGQHGEDAPVPRAGPTAEAASCAERKRFSFRCARRKMIAADERAPHAVAMAREWPALASRTRASGAARRRRLRSRAERPLQSTIRSRRLFTAASGTLADQGSRFIACYTRFWTTGRSPPCSPRWQRTLASLSPNRCSNSTRLPNPGGINHTEIFRWRSYAVRNCPGGFHLAANLRLFPDPVRPQRTRSD